MNYMHVSYTYPCHRHGTTCSRPSLSITLPSKLNAASVMNTVYALVRPHLHHHFTRAKRARGVTRRRYIASTISRKAIAQRTAVLQSQRRRRVNQKRMRKINHPNRKMTSQRQRPVTLSPSLTTVDGRTKLLSMMKGQSNAKHSDSDLSSYLMCATSRSCFGWILDGGSTNHICMDRLAFATFTPTTDSIKGIVKNGPELQVLSTSTVLVTVSVQGRKECMVKLINVSYCPNTCDNLMSVSQMNQKGMEITKRGG